jgi:hypothetical protein
MSNYQNQRLIDEAVEWADAWEGTLHAELIRLHLSTGDLEALHQDVLRARTDWYDLEERYVESDYADIY